MTKQDVRYFVAHHNTDEALLFGSLKEATNYIEESINDGDDPDNFRLFSATEMSLNIEVVVKSVVTVRE